MIVTSSLFNPQPPLSTLVVERFGIGRDVEQYDLAGAQRFYSTCQLGRHLLFCCGDGAEMRRKKMWTGGRGGEGDLWTGRGRRVSCLREQANSGTPRVLAQILIGIRLHWTTHAPSITPRPLHLPSTSSTSLISPRRLFSAGMGCSAAAIAMCLANQLLRASKTGKRALLLSSENITHNQ